jgi:hypothetical protein
MKMIFTILAASLIFSGSATADDGSKYYPDPIITHEEAAGMGCWTCTTHSKGKKTIAIMAESRDQAMEAAIKHCILGGGYKNECNANVFCQISDDHHPGPTEMKPFFDFGRGENGYGYCYQFDANMQVMNKGMPVADFNCDLTKSYYGWALHPDGELYCHRWTPYKHIMNKGQIVDAILCRKGNPWPYED